MSTSFLRIFSTLGAILILASCGAGELEQVRGDSTSEVQAIEFQDQLDALSLPLSLPAGRAILVNIPSFELIAFEDGTPVLRSRVIVGKPQTRTPRIDTYTTAVLFWPSWRPTQEMIASGEVPDRIFSPGPDNPMGVLAISLEPGMDVYMHDTNQRHLFQEEHRAFSHGCIRVERWDALAAWLLDRDVSWVKTMSSGPFTRRARTPNIPVLIRYFTVFPSADGTVEVYPDIYELAGRRMAYRVSAKNRARCSPDLP